MFANPHKGDVSILNVAVLDGTWTSQLGQLVQAYLICAALPHSCTTPIWIIRWQVWGPVRVCEQCHKLREVYWKAIVEVARLEQLLNGDVAPETIYGLATHLRRRSRPAGLRGMNSTDQIEK